MADALEPLLEKLSGYAPRFGRAESDISAMVSRARAGDYKGVMQNARLVLEALLRSLVTDELRQTPGKAMLDELVSKFRQQANAGIVPTNILAHMGTVQAWGNLSSHDHAGSLSDAPVQVGRDEVLASVNSMVAILGWYAGRQGLGEAPTAGRSARSGQRLRWPAALGLLALVGLGGVAFWATLRSAGAVERPSPPLAGAPEPDRGSQPFAALDAVYAAWGEPAPPAACRDEAEAGRLVRAVRDVNALGLIESPSPEAAYLLARATFEDLKRASPALDVALRCPGFATARFLAARVAIADGRLGDAKEALAVAVHDAPGFLDARASLGGVLLEQGDTDAGLAEAEGLVAAAPEYAAGYLLRFAGKVRSGDKAGGLADLCTAVRLGSAEARRKQESIGATCEAHP